MGIKRLLRTVLLLGAVWFICHTAFIIYDGTRQPQRPAEIIVVLGSKVNPDGSLCPRLKARLDKALALYQGNMGQRIAVSGGLGKEGHYEGTVMAAYLVNQGVPTSRIIIDDLGVNTAATAHNIREATGNASVIVVSQYFHITRTKRFFAKVGFTDIQGASPAFLEIRDLYSVPREFIAYYVSLFR